MISQLRNNKSLTFYQSINSQTNYGIHSSYEGGLGADAISQTFYTTSAETNSFNNQLNYYLDSLQSKCDRIYQKVSEHLASNPSYTGARGDAVKLAWEYEHADIIMGGKGSGNWNKAQIDEILKMKKVKNAEGHHQKNVASHLHEQGNPNNIKFYKNRNEHKNKGHGGNFKNKSDAPYIDKNDMLKKTNFKRVFKNELRGIGLAAAIGAGIGFTLGFAVTLAQ